MGCSDSKDAQQAEGIAAFYGKTVTVKSVHGKYLRPHEGGEGSKVDQANELGHWEKWTVEDAGEGKFRLKSVHGTYLRAVKDAEAEGAFAKVDMAAEAADWEVFEAVAEGEKFWRIKTAHGTFLRAADGDDGADVNQQVEASLGDWENWTVEVVEEEQKKDEEAAPAAAAPAPAETVMRLVGQTVTIKSAAHGTFLKCHPADDDNKVAQADVADQWELFVIAPVEGQDGRYLIQSKVHEGLNLHAAAAANEGETNPRVKSIDATGEWEQWAMEEVEGDSVRFKSYHGTYMRADAGGQDAAIEVVADADDATVWILASQ